MSLVGGCVCKRLCNDNEIVSFFFFKQKTAYELRISDWSSDVCSSDLMCIFPKATACIRPGAISHGFGKGRRIAIALAGSDQRAGAFRLDKQIGRASCRERVCQYV